MPPQSAALRLPDSPRNDILLPFLTPSRCLRATAGQRLSRAWLVGRASANREYRCRRSAGMDARRARRGCMTDAGFAARLTAMRAMLISSALAAAFALSAAAGAAPTSLLPVEPEAPAPAAALAPLAKDSVWTPRFAARSEEHTSELQSLMRISYAVFCLN